MLIPLQVTVSVVLLTGAVLLTRSLRHLEAGDAGVDRDHLLLVAVDAGRRDYNGDRFLGLAQQVSARLAALPGVQAASYSQNGLFSGNDGTALVDVPGFMGRTSGDSILQYDLVGPSYVHAVGGGLLRGRDIDAHDGPRTPGVAIVNESMERFYFGRASALGRTIYFDAGIPTTIVGVVADMRQHSLAGPPQRRAYMPYAQQIASTARPSLVFELRTDDDPSARIKDAAQAIAAVDPDLPLETVTPLSQLIGESIREQRLVVAITIGFGAAALLLAVLGLYGVMSYAVAQRAGEIGLRAALGARRREVLSLVLGDALRLVSIGVIAGLPLALVAARALRSQLHGVPPGDPISLAIAMAVPLISAGAAALLPALRATRVAPAAALQEL
jgi:predicted permease